MQFLPVILKRCGSACLAMLSVCVFTYLYHYSRPFPVVIHAQLRPAAKIREPFQIILPKYVLMRHVETHSSECYFPNFTKLKQKADRNGKIQPMTFFLRQGEKLYFPKSGFQTVAFPDMEKNPLSYEISGDQSTIFKMPVPDMGVFFRVSQNTNLFWLGLCLFVGILLSPGYATILLMTALFAGLELCLFPRINPLRTVAFASVLLLTIKKWPDIIDLFKEQVRKPFWLFFSLFTTLLMARIPLYNRIADAFPTAYTQLTIYLLMLYPAVFLTCLVSNFLWEKVISSPAFVASQPEFSGKISSLLHHRLIYVAAAILYLGYLYAHNPMFLNKYKFFCKYRLGHLLYSYELAFMPRALAGTAFCWFSKYFSQVALFQFLYWSSVALCLGLIFGIIRKIRDARHIAVLSLLTGLYFSLPVTHLHLINDFARLDFSLLVICIFSVAMIWRNSPLKWVIPVLIPAATLIHELFLLFYLPTIIAATLWNSQWKNKKNVAFLTTCILASAAAIILFCCIKNNTPSAEELSKFCSVKDQYQRTFFSGYALSIIEENYAFHIRNLINEIIKNRISYLTGMIFTLLALAYPLHIWCQLLRSGISGQPRFKLLFLALAAFAPFSAALIIVDYPRWQAAICHTNFLLLIFLLSDQDTNTKIPFPTRKTTIVMGSMIILFLFSGPADWLQFSELCKNIALSFTAMPPF
ncbi:MAG: hypothetical protein WCT05_09815 [Lentisphaeria bacterium]